MRSSSGEPPRTRALATATLALSPLAESSSIDRLTRSYPRTPRGNLCSRRSSAARAADRHRCAVEPAFQSGARFCCNEPDRRRGEPHPFEAGASLNRGPSGCTARSRTARPHALCFGSSEFPRRRWWSLECSWCSDRGRCRRGLGLTHGRRRPRRSPRHRLRLRAEAWRPASSEGEPSEALSPALVEASRCPRPRPRRAASRELPRRAASPRDLGPTSRTPPRGRARASPAPSSLRRRTGSPVIWLPFFRLRRCVEAPHLARRLHARDAAANEQCRPECPAAPRSPGPTSPRARTRRRRGAALQGPCSVPPRRARFAGATRAGRGVFREAGEGLELRVVGRDFAAHRRRSTKVAWPRAGRSRTATSSKASVPRKSGA